MPREGHLEGPGSLLEGSLVLWYHLGMEEAIKRVIEALVVKIEEGPTVELVESFRTLLGHDERMVGFEKRLKDLEARMSMVPGQRRVL